MANGAGTAGSPASLSVTTLLHEAYLDIARVKAAVFHGRGSWGMPRV